MSDMKKLMESIDRIQSEDEFVTKRVVGHKDNETRMMQRDLLKIQEYAGELLKMLDNLEDGDFPHWWQAKLVKASDYISTCKHFLEGELELGPRTPDGGVEDVAAAQSELPPEINFD